MFPITSNSPNLKKKSTKMSQRNVFLKPHNNSIHYNKPIIFTLNYHLTLIYTVDKSSDNEIYHSLPWKIKFSVPLSVFLDEPTIIDPFYRILR